jgi:hypothetical protein
MTTRGYSHRSTGARKLCSADLVLEDYFDGELNLTRRRGGST